MCGIAGIVDFSGRPVNPEEIQRMNDRIRHRGPDDDGVWIEGPVALAMRRLSILDVSGGHQPMFDESGRIVTVYNGEIYNYPELRRELIARGHTLRTTSDTEVIPHLFEEKDRRLVDDLRGMFAFAVWDRAQRSLLLARDRLGIKPLYYMWDGRRIIFASELKSIQALGACGAVSSAAVRCFVNYGYIPAPLTIYENVFKLKPGHTLHARDGKATVERYWDVEYAPHNGRSEDDVVDELKEILADSVKRHLLSDVPLGAFLSGGVDSSLVVALMSEVAGTQVRTFSISFDEESYDEAPHARRVAERFATQHTEYTVRPEIRESIDPIIAQFDEPFADSSAVPTYFVCKAARQDVTVALSGDGGDELFAGYDRYREYLRKRPLYRVPRGVRRAAFGTASGLMPLGTRGKRFLRSLALTPLMDYVVGSAELTLESLLTEDYAGENATLSAFAPARDVFAQSVPTELDAVCHHDLKLYLPDDILTKVDRTSMAVSLEVRVPLLDHRVVEWAARLPADLRIRNGQGKYILKRLLERYLPHEHVHRRKQGFGVPFDRWFRHELRDLIQERLSPAEVRRVGVFRPEAVEYLMRQHLSGGRNFESLIWKVFVMQTWMRMAA
jgi:asparagine synthase (glutamine-hydrolysing)